jgi:SNF2 family DNA or RNA helicase
MNISCYTKESLKSLCHPADYEKAEAILKNKSVLQLIYKQSDEWLDCLEVFAIVEDGRMHYNAVTSLFLPDEDEKPLTNFPYIIHPYCNCSSFSSYCEHTIAALLTLQELISGGVSPDDLLMAHWLESIQSNTPTQAMTDHDPSYELFFELVLPSNIDKPIELHPQLYRRLKNGSLGASKNWNSRDLKNHHLRPDDVMFLVALEAATRLSHANVSHYRNFFVINEAQGLATFEQIVHAGRVHLKGNKHAILSLGKPRDITFKWETTAEQKQQLRFSLPSSMELFFIQGPWYLNKKTKTIGSLNTDLSKHALIHLISMPPVPKAYAMKVNSTLATLPGLNTIPAMQVLDTDVPVGKPTPHLYFHSLSLNSPKGFSAEQSDSNKTPAILLSFQYEGELIPWHNESSLVMIDGKATCVRAAETESQALQVLAKAGLMLLKKTPFFNSNEEHANVHLFVEQTPFDFWQQLVPSLIEKGWTIQVDDDYEHRLIEEEVQDWYANVEDTETSDWFSFELGVMVQGEKVNLLPIIQNLLRNLNEKQELSDIQNQIVYAKLPNKHYLPIPGERLYAMMQTLIELFDKKSLSLDDKLILSKSEAARLIEVEKALGAAQLRWLSTHKMQILAEKISEFKGIQSISPPQGLKAVLRPYQQEGLEWMQFLREYELAGILADDMGLGKTIQAISHILIEKESGRLKSPALVIAPTSLMYNWEQECKRFAPDLSVLVLHGASRKAHLDNIGNYDVVLTTYPLILRDKEFLLQHTFHLLILDEAQFVKNNKSLGAQIVMQLKANHRLCLTGTPMENHLGELWSLFHFLMPGLLGDATTFSRRFRTPVEKHGDNERRQILCRRIAPFLLRRTKTLVAKELPPKIETISYVELEEDQRDLYETIRVAMEDKVRQEVAKLGLARSHIIILDALLKLRQVCCDPKLLKTENKKNQISSCKITLLKDMLPELVEEGRRILIFSSFTQMLNIIEQMVQELNIDYVRLTGETKDRKTPIERFQNLEVPLFLISLKAGGTGLNLTAADTVIHIDPWWNPAAENQATDRAYRIGQDKTVFVYKIVTKGTVEEKILAMQAKKQALADGIFSDKSTEKSKLTENDLQVLFAAL